MRPHIFAINVALVLIIVIVFVTGICTFNMSEPDRFDYPLSNKEIMVRSISCDKRDMEIKMICDDELNVYAVKCVNKEKKK